MDRKIINRVVAFFLLAFVSAVSMPAQDYKPWLGKWSMTSETGGDPVTWTLVLKEVDGKVAAVLASEQGEQPAKDTTFAEGVLKFKAPYQGEDYNIELKLKAEKLDGTWSGGGDSGTTSGTRL